MLLGVIGGLLHLAAWIVAIVFDAVSEQKINQDESPGSMTYWQAGFIPLTIALGVLLAWSILHAIAFCLPTNYYFNLFYIEEGGAAPWLMTSLIAGVHISILFTILQMIGTMGAFGTDYNNYMGSELSVKEQKDFREEQRMYLVLSLIAKVYVVNFLRNNQEWAGPAAKLKSEDASNGKKEEAKATLLGSSRL